MPDEILMAELLAFFKALADENRLKIVGLLAQQPYTVEKLAEALGLSVSTVSHHLGRLAKANLVKAQVDGHYYWYSLQLDVLRDMSQHLSRTESVSRLSEESMDAFEKKVMSAFVEADGRIKALPAQAKKYEVLLRYVLKAFEPGVRYTEKQVNEIIQRYHPDTAMIRRSMIEYKFMERESNGLAYWLAQAPAEK